MSEAYLKHAKICTVVGARPQFIKAAALSRVLRREQREVLIHTGQHYDYNMSDIFFDELQIPKPEYNLGISGGSHGRMTGQMLAALEEVFKKEQPEMAVVYGDTNSTLAGALAAVKLHIPICHVEAGVRMGSLLNPEEVNRVLTDRISTLFMCCTETAIGHLQREGITQGVQNVGDLMYDAVLHYERLLERPTLKGLTGERLELPERYYLLTCHREENTGSDEPLEEIFSAMEQAGAPVVYPVHPRNRARAERLLGQNGYRRILLAEPVGYLASLYLVRHAERVVTDSGGLQREAWFFARPCVTLLDTPPWPETLAGKMNQICRAKERDILEKLGAEIDYSQRDNQFGDGHAAEKITRLIGQYLGR